MEFVLYFLKEYFRKIIKNILPHYFVRKYQDKKLMQIGKEIFHYRQKGFCPVCNENVIFSSTKTWLRDNFICTNCGSIPRQRALMLTIEKYYPNWMDLKIHESSPCNCSVSNKLKQKCNEYIGSQYFPSDEFGKITNGYRNENLEDQTFGNEEFNIVITQDVFEHIFNPQKAFSEIARTLKKNGSHIFTVPIINKFNKTEIWAKKGSGGEIIFLKNEEWHENPVDIKGSPVTMHWGYDIVNFIKEYSGLETNVEYIHNLHFGIWAEYNEVLISKK
jgi:transcription elongation factor Elf1